MFTAKDKIVEIFECLSNKGIMNSRLITEDGLVIISNNSESQGSNVNMENGAIVASIISIAEKGLEILNENVILEQVKIDIGIDDNIENDFIIIIERICLNLLLQVIFPKRINIGIIHYETNKAISKIKSIVSENALEDSKKFKELLIQ